MPGGVSFYAETVVDFEVPVARSLVNRLVAPLVFSKATADRWIRHNIEETGRTQDILPVLYAAAMV